MEQRQARQTELSFTPQQLCASFEKYLNYIETLLDECAIPRAKRQEICAALVQMKTIVTLSTSPHLGRTGP